MVPVVGHRARVTHLRFLGFCSLVAALGCSSASGTVPQDAAGDAGAKQDAGDAGATQDAGTSAIFADSFESGDFKHTSGGVSWYGNNYGSAGTPPVVSSANPHSGTSHMRIREGSATSGGNGSDWAEQDIALPLLSEFWIEYYLNIPAGFAYADSTVWRNNKFFGIFGRAPGDANHPLFDFEISPGASSNYDVFAQTRNGTDTAAIRSPGNLGHTGAGVIGPTGLIVPGTGYHRIRIYCKSTSAAGANDAVQELWVDDTLAFQYTGFDSSYGAGSPLVGTYPATFNAGYFQGADNGPYSQENYIDLDDFTIYDANPGW